MTCFITTTCPVCGEIETPLDAVVLRVNEETARALCSIRCVICGSRYTKPVDDSSCLLLETFGVRIEEWTRPAEVDERPAHLPPMSPEEIDTFVALLSTADMLVPLFS